MTAEAQRIAIAEACGWKRLDTGGWRRPDGTIENQHYGEEWRLPDYLNDLNAMHEAVMAQGWGDSEEVDFIFALLEVCDQDKQDPFASTCATAAQRAEALLRTIVKWTP